MTSPVFGLVNQQEAAEMGVGEVMVRLFRGEIVRKIQANSLG
jgi:FixJ family two-component response regulator